MGNWTHRGNRGFVTGLWSTCGSVGNILGLQIAPLLLTHWDNKWYYLMWIVGCAYLFVALAMFLFMVPEPSDVGVLMEQENVEFQRDSPANSHAYQQVPQYSERNQQ